MNRLTFRSSIRRVVVLLAMIFGIGMSNLDQASAQVRTTTRRKPADYRSAHFLIHTDLTAEEAKKLLARMETMLSIISRYWGRSPSGVIECYVARNVSNWPAGTMDPRGRQQIAAEGGVTLSKTRRRGDRFESKAVVYAHYGRGTALHESVHAYCSQAFGRTGPTWYAEGMAEMGQYWKKAGDTTVNTHPMVLKYLKVSRPKPIEEITATGQTTGDSWQNYAWRWALCHLLAYNTNYADRFRPLGMGLLTGKDVSFDKTYGAMVKQLNFEYRFFLKHMDTGYRADLCSWDWRRRFTSPTSERHVAAKIEAGRGWQASGLTLNEGTEYAYSAAGTWKTAKDAAAVTADGADDGSGWLLGIIMKEMKLGEPFLLGTYGSFKAPQNGKLYLRCHDGWTDLADNTGELSVKFKRKDKGDPLPRPKGQ
jgi:hypothetical protein